MPAKAGIQHPQGAWALKDRTQAFADMTATSSLQRTKHVALTPQGPCNRAEKHSAQQCAYAGMTNH